VLAFDLREYVVGGVDQDNSWAALRGVPQTLAGGGKASQSSLVADSDGAVSASIDRTYSPR
jgi:hypothetical protein